MKSRVIRLPVGGQSIPDNQQRLRKMSEQCLQEVHHLGTFCRAL
jgi:hypothetical protein